MLFQSGLLYEKKYKNIKFILKILMILSFLYSIIYPSIYTIQKNNNKNILTEEYNKNLSQIKPSPIDEEMQNLIDEKIQRDFDKKLAINAKLFYNMAKEYLESNYRDSKIPIISFIFDDQYEYYRYNNGHYDIIFDVTIGLSNGSFLKKRFYFYMDEDDLKRSDKVWNILDYE